MATNGRQVAHLWAQQAQPSAKGYGHIYFEGDTIYSYGSHFPMARIVTNKRGERAYFYTTRGYSNTTSKHLSWVRGAIPHGAPIFYTADVCSINPKAWFDEQQLRAADLLGKAQRAQKRGDELMQEFDELCANVEAYKKFFGVRLPKILRTSADKMRGEIEARAKRARKVQAAADAKRELARRKAEAEARAKWLAGEYDGLYIARPALLRVDADEVVTSMGARVPVDHAAKLLQFVRQVVARKAEYVSNGHTVHVGHFAVDRIEANGTLHAGCHEIEYSEIDRIAPQVEVAAKAEQYQPKTGAKCSCRPGIQRDNCPNCEGTGMVIDFAAIRARA